MLPTAIDERPTTKSHTDKCRNFRRDTRPSNNDNILREIAQRMLVASGHRVLASVSVEVKAGEIRLFGTLPSYFMKQLAQESVRRVPHLKAVCNNVEVNAPSGEFPH